MLDWLVMKVQGKLILGLMQGAEDNKVLGVIYDNLPGSELWLFSNDSIGSFIYSRELGKFWTYKTVWKKDLPNMKFGINADGVIVPGTEAVETTIESYYALCKRAPKGARARVREFFGKKSGK